MILQTDRPQPLIPNQPAPEAVLIMESRPSRFSGSGLSGLQTGWTQMYQAGQFHLHLNFQSTPSGGTLHGQVISLNRLKLAQTQIQAGNVIGTAILETEFGQLEASANINANGDFEVVLEQPALYPLTLRLLSQHGLDLNVPDLDLY